LHGNFRHGVPQTLLHCPANTRVAESSR
jgi:hypothetical protein